MSETVSSGDTEKRAAQELAIRAECVRIVYRHRLRNLISHIVVVTLPLSLGWKSDGFAGNLLLVGALLLYVAFSLRFTISFNRFRIDDVVVIRRERYLYVSMVFLGSLYNAIFMHLAWWGEPNAMFYLVLTSACFSAGGVTSYQHIRWLGPTFVVSVIVPQVIYYGMFDTSHGGGVVALLLVIFVVFMANVGKELHEDAVETMRLNMELVDAKADAERLSMTDPLTGVPNRRAFYVDGQRQFSRVERYGGELSVIMLDIDHFKKVNDSYGHAVGDAALVMVAKVLMGVVRESDTVGRVGGEEFALLLPATDGSAAAKLADRICDEVRRIVVPTPSGDSGLTVSAGVARWEKSLADLDALIARADQVLYKAKQAGRDRVAVYRRESDETA